MKLITPDGNDGKEDRRKTCPFMSPAFFQKTPVVVPGVGQKVDVQVIPVPCTGPNCAVWDAEHLRCGVIK